MDRELSNLRELYALLGKGKVSSLSPMWINLFDLVKEVFPVLNDQERVQLMGILNNVINYATYCAVKDIQESGVDIATVFGQDKDLLLGFLQGLLDSDILKDSVKEEVEGFLMQSVPQRGDLYFTHPSLGL